VNGDLISGDDVNDQWTPIAKGGPADIGVKHRDLDTDDVNDLEP
jgi:hypothetical protein